MRYDLSIIASWIAPGSRVLGLGCGEGDLLHFLKTTKQVQERGIEIKESRVARCIEKGISVLQGDINTELEDYADNTFDYAICSQTLQQVYEPQRLIRSMMRVAQKGVVSFPNFGHYKVRLQYLMTGRAPVTRSLPYEWYNTPNIRVLSLKDFERFSKAAGFRIIKRAAINTRNEHREGNEIRIFPNMFAAYGLYLIGKA
ncbi:MAG: methionine biosynthesis protein MetW [Desulfobacteraceae bacterium]|nr:MAG: methionine biosynthesis protein MetW [Desulfobacteraceae bacterium]